MKPRLQPEPHGFETIHLGGLQLEDAQELLARTATGGIPGPVSERLYAATRGNPLALVELPSLLTREQIEGTVAVSEPLPAGRSIQDAYLHRVDALPDEARRGLLLVAAATEERLEPIAGALAELGLDVSGLQSAEDAKLLVVGTATPASGTRWSARPSITRPREASGGQRMRRWPRRWNGSAIRIVPLVIWLLQRSVQTRPSRGSQQPEHAPASALPSLPLRTPSGRQRAFPPNPSLAGSGSPTLPSRRGQEGRPLAQRSSSTRPSRHPATRSSARECWSCGDGWSCKRAARPTLAHSSRRSSHSRRRWNRFARRTRSRTSSSAVTSTDGSRRRWPPRVAAARSWPQTGARRTCGPTTCSGGRSCWRARSTGEALLQRIVTSAFAAEDAPRAQLAAAATSLSILERHEECRALIARVLELARAEGPMALTYALSMAAETELRGGRVQRAVASAAEGVALARQLGQANIAATFLVVLARADAIRGREASFDAAADEAVARLDEAGMALTREQLRCSEGLLQLALGRVEEAAATLEQATTRAAEMGLVDRDVAPSQTWSRHSCASVARRRHGKCSTPGGRASTPARFPGLHRSRPAAGVSSRTRTASSRSTSKRFACTRAATISLARTVLCFGEALRRAGRKSEAREQLREAHRLFEEIEAAPGPTWPGGSSGRPVSGFVGRRLSSARS